MKTTTKDAAMETVQSYEKLATMPVRTPDKAQERLKVLYDTGLSWREIAALDDYKPIPPGSLCTFAKTGELATKWRVRLGLPVEGKVKIIFGLVPDGSQVIGAELCDCGQWYVSNHPARKRCFICSPWRGRK